MAKFDSSLKGIMQTEFSVGGPDGLKIVDGGTVLSVEDSASLPVNVSGADPVLSNHFVTKNYSDSTYLTPADHLTIDQLVHLIAETSYQEITRTGGQVTNVSYWTNSSKTIKIRETDITRASGQVSQIVLKQYDNLGVLSQTLTGVVTRTSGQVASIDWVLT